ncbi:MAG TPA: non-ribosomal peptide synthetase, partial [Candidatus Deferrimicrobium sp.]|nr:non-ribosomal peptide synthetase [Candidatus Deferrimicrobium sp.]
INGYGPTENTTFSTTFKIDRAYNQRIPIGNPIANSIAYVVDKPVHLVPVGVSGELWVGGDGVSRGYLNNPELTRERFINFHHSKLYRTGDLVRRLEDGTIEFMGRIDQQVKIRGFRIELAEIENRLLKHPDIKEAKVLDKNDNRSDKYLCAYIVSGRFIDEAELKQYLSNHLPAYMIPTYFILLDLIPLTSNGKLDREALPEPGVMPGVVYSAPRNEIEKKIVAIWSDVLVIEKGNISIDADFFDLGGHSLKVTSIIARIQKEFNLKLELVQVFRAPTIKAIASLIEAVNWLNHKSKEPTIGINMGQESEEIIL